MAEAKDPHLENKLEPSHYKTDLKTEGTTSYTLLPEFVVVVNACSWCLEKDGYKQMAGPIDTPTNNLLEWVFRYSSGR